MNIENRKDALGIPTPVSPADGISTLDKAVQFCWTSIEKGFGYELQIARKGDFSDAESVVMQNLEPATKRTHLPEKPLSSGDWFWRVRGMDGEGIFGNWSPVRSFTTRSASQQMPPERTISADHPLFILFCGDEIVENWESVPEHLKPHVVFRVEQHTTEELLPVCELAQEHNIPLLIQLAGPHDVYSGKYARIPLSDVELIYQRFPTVKGVQIVEQSCQGGLKQPRVIRYLMGMMHLAAAYGKVAVWADGHWHGNNIWIDASLHEELYRTMCACREYIIPMWKMNCGWTPYGVQGATFGMWAGGAVANWGIEPESWFWFEAGFRELDKQVDFKNGAVDGCPAPFWGQMILMGLSSGAAAYCIEPPNAMWSAPGVIAPKAREVVFPLLSRMIEWRLIPTREEILERTPIAYITGQADSPFREDGGTLRTLYQGTYGLDHPFEMIPATGRYGWIPLLSPHTSPEELARYAALIHANSFQTPEAARAYFDGMVPAKSEGTACAIFAGKVQVITNHHENRDIQESFCIPLNGPFLRLEGELAVNGYVIIQQQESGGLRIHSNGRNDRAMTLRLFVGGSSVLQIEATPEHAVSANACEESSKCHILTVSFAEGAVDLIVTPGKGKKG
ncbi:MAG: hypothetical protein V1800_01960 [Candidatus Latescibacterota bacterium]